MVDSQDTTQQDAADQGVVGLLSAISTADLMDLDEDMIELFKTDSLKLESFSNVPSGNEDDHAASQGLQQPPCHYLQPQQMIPAPPPEPHQLQQQLLLLTTTSASSEVLPTSLEHLNKAPTLDEFHDPAYDFDVSLNGETSGKSSWMYSSKLHKVFVKMAQPCTFNVAYRGGTAGANAEQQRDLRLRVMLVCSAPEDLHERIYRCENHRGNDRDSKRFSPDVIAHVMRCFNPSARYVGAESGVAFRDRLAVVIPLGASLQNLPTLAVSLEFVCQNSCRIINRRQTAIIFTLEDESGQILGKKSIHLKVCSCPKRDKQKEEEALAPATEKRKSDLPPAAAPPGKKVAKLSTAHRNPSGGGTGGKMTFIKKEQPDSPPSDAVVERGKIPAGTVRGVPVQLTPQNSAELVEQTATTINVPMPSVSAAVKVAEYAFQVVAGDLVRSSNDEDRKHLAAYLTQIRRLQSKYEQFV